MKDVKKIKKNDFKGMNLNLEGLVIVECYKPGYGALQIMEPILDKLRNNYQHKLTHVRLNVEKESFAINTFYINRFPTYLIFKDCYLKNIIPGIIPLKDFMEEVEQILKP